ncbi:hypothetical protein DFQ04_1036 [Algoriphagus boseongensis]|uniref:Glycosyltransferase A (GT-A) superfamily protein (DUF2064 family) n=1 Tax=Algoriphagus boseongensis TaxID=1442587 RepID=A0A4V3D2J9_9BACT|nr:TIGR04282 family arsenosugar biosynthesis glycosyltransferase [Algoriphagus boseongensis]TDQ19217.1 hypothetical protein DFQ04_1036 [Algoriphagus boseongensis]
MSKLQRSKQAIIVFQKNFTLGKVKTRLADTMGSEKAFEIYQELVDLTYQSIYSLDAQVFLFFSDYVPEDFTQSDWILKVQSGKDLGERMENALNSVFDLGFPKALIIGTDCPYLNSTIYLEAFEKLNSFDLVIGPAEDGGYYLLGLKKNVPNIFRNMEWSTPKVFIETVSRANSEGLSYQFLPRLSDIDTEEDWNQFLKSKPNNPSKMN